MRLHVRVPPMLWNWVGMAPSSEVREGNWGPRKIRGDWSSCKPIVLGMTRPRRDSADVWPIHAEEARLGMDVSSPS